MDITFKKRKQDLEGEVKLKSLDIEHIDENFQPVIENCELKQEFIAISPECVRCNLCVEECPVKAAISPAERSSSAKILNGCVKCEICAQTCPVNAMKVIESTTNIDDQVEYHIKELKIPHRKLRMKQIRVADDKCNACGDCVKFCPTEVITIKDEIAEIDKSLCIGCGACVNVCPKEAISLTRELGPVIKTKKLIINQEACVQCQVCEENCPMEAIKLEGDEIVLNMDKCILCDVCSTKCPVGAIELEKIKNES